MRIHELAKELNVDSKAVIGFLTGKGIDAKTPSSNVTDDVASMVKKHFSNAVSEKKSSAPRAVALPDYIVKKVEAEAKAHEAKETSSVSEEPTNDKKDVSDDKKKKKIIAVFNPHNASSHNGRGIGKQNERSKDTVKKQPYQGQKNTQVREKVQEEEKAPVKKVRPSTRIPAKDRIPDDELLEMKKAEELALKKAEEERLEQERLKAEAEAQALELAAKEEKLREEKAKEERLKEEKAREEKLKEEKAKEEKAKEEKAKETAKESTAKTSPRETVSIDADKQKSSQAVNSLRDKIVKGKVSVSDIQISKPVKKEEKKFGHNNNNSNNNNKDNNGRREDRRPNNNQFRKNQDGQGQNPRNPRQGQNQQNGQYQGQNQQNGQNQRFKPRDKDRDNKIAVQDVPQTADKGKGGKGGRPNKAKFEKQKGDKFDRFENERGLQKKQNEVKVKEEEEIKVISIPDTIDVKDFAAKLKMQPAALIKKLFLQGKVLTVNDILDFETAESIALDMDIICEHEVEVNYIEELLKEEEEDESLLVKRPPVVCVMGHVDHGKTSLLDAIRNTNVIAKEAGGITQHIGAYQVTLPSGEKLTFLDTPGHEAFTAMRLRGAMATDVAILVVAADDGVMPQTIEAISHAKAAGIHVIVAVNKIDKPGADVEKVKQELTEYGLVAEDWGGDTIFCPVSAKKNIGIEQLLEMVILDTEILDLKANPKRKARGLVIEAKLDKGRGSVATLLVQKGTLKVGDYIAMGESYGRVRSLTTAEGSKVKEAGPSVPVEITGMNGVPNAGDVFVAFDSDKEAKAFAQVFIEDNKKKLLAGTKAKKMNLEDIFDQMKSGEVQNLDIIIKADVKGSVGALKESLEKLSNDEVNVRVIHSGVGNINESDAILASASNAIIIAFNVSADSVARDVIEHEKVDVRHYNVIYNVIDDVELAMKGMLKPIYEENVVGHAEVRQTFKASGIGVIAGSYILDGVLKRDSKIRLSRGGEVIYDGQVASLKRFNDDVKEVKTGYECGIVLKDYQDIKEGDTMEAYEMREVPRQ